MTSIRDKNRRPYWHDPERHGREVLKVELDLALEEGLKTGVVQFATFLNKYALGYPDEVPSLKTDRSRTYYIWPGEHRLLVRLYLLSEQRMIDSDPVTFSALGGGETTVAAEHIGNTVHLRKKRPA